ncbi:hypothetical protein [Peptococcus niger]|uniref:Uncharacterized protein n=1 Tax=Peptococcus niger TaxID=2741 RepID=A0A1G7AB07_PEPNI|nr:hypothetical protein [Peptococcus niger]SDE11056.1 hypothetical protein SAMN04489866_1203 [Peptococcus niger]
MIIRKNYSYSGLNRKGEDGTFLCIPGLLNKRIFLDEQVVEIYNECNGHSIETLFSLQKEKYKEEDEIRIKEDLENILWFFHNIGMLELKGEDLMVFQNTEEIFQMISEKDFNGITNFIFKTYEHKNDDILYYINPQYNIKSYYDLHNFYNLPNLRLSHVSGGNIYYKFSKEGSKEIDGVISFNFIESNTTIYINLVICEKAYFTQLIQLLYNEMKKNGYKILKVKLLKNKEHELLLYKSGFVKEAVLKGETFDGEDIFIYLLEK